MGRLPFYGRTTAEVNESLKYDEVRWVKPPPGVTLPKGLTRLIKFALIRSPQGNYIWLVHRSLNVLTKFKCSSERLCSLTYDEFLRSSYFHDVDWKKLQAGSQLADVKDDVSQALKSKGSPSIKGMSPSTFLDLKKIGVSLNV